MDMKQQKSKSQQSSLNKLSFYSSYYFTVQLTIIKWTLILSRSRRPLQPASSSFHEKEDAVALRYIQVVRVDSGMCRIELWFRITQFVSLCVVLFFFGQPIHFPSSVESLYIYDAKKALIQWLLVDTHCVLYPLCQGDSIRYIRSQTRPSHRQTLERESVFFFPEKSSFSCSLRISQYKYRMYFCVNTKVAL